MTAPYVVKSAWPMYHSRISVPDVMRFLRDQHQTGALAAALVIVDADRQLALMATQSPSRGACFMSTGWSLHLLILPIGRWSMIAQSIGFPIVHVETHRGSSLPALPTEPLRRAVASLAKRQ